MARRVDVDQMLEEMPAPLLAEWMAYDRIDPIGEERADYRNAILCTTIVNSNPYRSKDSSPATADMFMPYLDPEERQRIQLQRLKSNLMNLVEDGQLLDQKGKPIR